MILLSWINKSTQHYLTFPPVFFTALYDQGPKIVEVVWPITVSFACNNDEIYPECDVDDEKCQWKQDSASAVNLLNVDVLFHKWLELFTQFRKLFHQVSRLQVSTFCFAFIARIIYDLRANRSVKWLSSLQKNFFVIVKCYDLFDAEGN